MRGFVLPFGKDLGWVIKLFFLSLISNSSPMKTATPFRLAIAALIFSIVWIIFEHIMGYNTTRHDVGQFTRLVPALVFWGVLFIAVRNEKRKTGKLTFIDGWKAGIITSLVYSIGFTLVIIFYQQFINPEFYETFKAFTLSQLQEHHATREQIDSAMKETEMSYSGSAMSYAMLLAFSFVWGVILSAIAAMIYKSKKEVAVVQP